MQIMMESWQISLADIVQATLKHPCDKGCACTSAAGQRDAGAPFPHHHPHMASIKHLQVT